MTCIQSNISHSSAELVALNWVSKRPSGLIELTGNPEQRLRVYHDQGILSLPDHNAKQSISATCIGYSEINKSACSAYERHFPEHTNLGDITAINEKELPDFDFMCGGFPCQSFSISGRYEGFNDERGMLFFEMARIIREKQPRLFLFENVKGLLSVDQGRAFGTILSTLDELGYDIQWQVFNSKNFGVPQNRERVFIVGHLRGTSRPKIFPLVGCNSPLSFTGRYCRRSIYV